MTDMDKELISSIKFKLEQCIYYHATIDEFEDQFITGGLNSKANGIIESALLSIRKEALEEAAERAVNYCAPLFPWNDRGSYAAGLRAAIIGEDDDE